MINNLFPEENLEILLNEKVVSAVDENSAALAAHELYLSKSGQNSYEEEIDNNYQSVAKEIFNLQKTGDIIISKNGFDLRNRDLLEKELNVDINNLIFTSTNEETEEQPNGLNYTIYGKKFRDHKRKIENGKYYWKTVNIIDFLVNISQRYLKSTNYFKRKLKAAIKPILQVNITHPVSGDIVPAFVYDESTGLTSALSFDENNNRIIDLDSEIVVYEEEGEGSKYFRFNDELSVPKVSSQKILDFYTENNNDISYFIQHFDILLDNILPNQIEKYKITNMDILKKLYINYYKPLKEEIKTGDLNKLISALITPLPLTPSKKLSKKKRLIKNTRKFKNQDYDHNAEDRAILKNNILLDNPTFPNIFTDLSQDVYNGITTVDGSNYVGNFSQKVKKITKVEQFVLSLLNSIYTLETTQNGPGEVIS